MNTSLKLILRKTISLIRTRQKLTPFTNSLRLISGCSSQNVYLYDETPGVTIAKALTKYTDRTHTCGDLRLKNVGQKVVLAGWLEFQRMNKFLVLRDAYGHTQLIVDDKNEELKKTVAQLPYESIIKIEGTVAARPEDMKNKNQSTGEIEVLIEKFHVLNKATTLPFNIREFQKANESLRMQYRYLDLRFPTMQRNMRVRSTMLMKMRDFLANKRHFVDVETPTLFKATPGGAQEFVVPTRFPGQFYALVQSPQQFKQMLMAGAIDRYFQIARCYRDESTRSDRQPEFTQLDIEMSFTTANGIMELVEELIQRSWPDFLHLPNFSFRRIPYKKAMETYGTDKPDTRFDCTLNNCTEVFSKFQTTDEHFGAYYLMFPSKSWNFTKTVKTRLKVMNKQYPEAKLVTGKVTTRSDWITSVEKLLGRQLAENLAEKVNLPDDSVFILSYGSKKQVQSLLGKIRLEYAYDSEKSGNKVIKNGIYFAWITDFPLFEAGENPGSLNSAHHPFTAPHPDDIHLLAESPLDVRGLAYDLVLNGQEVGGGSIRVHDADLQEKLLHMLKIDKSTLQHMLDMLRSGCPPHGGIALGIDRLIATILDTPSIRDVIAFPKIFEGRDPVSGAPSEISDAEKKLYHIRTVDT